MAQQERRTIKWLEGDDCPGEREQFLQPDHIQKEDSLRGWRDREIKGVLSLSSFSVGLVFSRNKDLKHKVIHLSAEEWIYRRLKKAIEPMEGNQRMQQVSLLISQGSLQVIAVKEVGKQMSAKETVEEKKISLQAEEKERREAKKRRR